jgi:hypothetical protein
MVAATQVVSISPTGEVSSLRTPAKAGLDLRTLGPCKVQRATDIVFCEHVQAFKIQFLENGGTPFAGRVLTKGLWEQHCGPGIPATAFIQKGEVGKGASVVFEGKSAASSGPVLYFLDYEDAVIEEVCFLNAARRAGVF